MQQRQLGSQGLSVSAIGLGCMGLTSAYGEADEKESIATLHHAIDHGVTLFDTAETYGPFKNEELLGRALKGRRDQVIVATKFGFRIVNNEVTGANSHPDHIRNFIDAALQRLQMDHVDLLYQHRIDPAVPVEDVAGTVGDLVRQGKVRFFGLSEAGAANIRRAHTVFPVSALQSEYSLWERNLEADIIPVLRELKIGLVPFSPLGRGFLAGKVKPAEEYPENDYRSHDPRFQGENFEINRRAAQVVQDIAAARGVTAGQVAIAWLLHQGPDIVPIPGTKRITYLQENIDAAALTLDGDELQRLGDALAAANISGPRYGARHMSMIDR